MSKQVSDLNDCREMVFLEKFSHDNSNPITSLRNNYLSLLSMLSPSSPFSFNLCLNIINEDPGSSHGVRIVVNLITNTNY